jgi:hypothetical protein
MAPDFKSVHERTGCDVKPVLQALLLADHVYEDKNTGKKVIAGIFNRLWFARSETAPREIEQEGVKRQIVPGAMRAGSPYAYLSLTEIRGTLPCVLRYVALEDDKPLFQCAFDIRCDDPLGTVEVVVPLPPLPTEQTGVYALELVCDNEPVGCVRVVVQELKGNGHDNP